MIMNIFWIIAIALICYLVFLIYPIYEAVKKADKLIATTTPFEQHPSNPEFFFLVAGDSTALGVGAADRSQSTAGRLGQKFPKADILNLGQSGATLNSLLAVMQSQKDKHYDLILLQIGANDITHLTSYDTIKSELSQILSICTKISPKTILLTSGDVGAAPVFQWPLSIYLRNRTLNVRQIFITESAKYPTVSYIDLYKEPNDDPFLKDIDKYYAPDSFHLSGEGYGLWFAEIQKKLPNYSELSR